MSSAWAKRGGPSAAPNSAVYPALQPVLNGPLAAYSLQSGALTDRSGNGYTMAGTYGAAQSSADLIRTKKAFRNNILQLQVPANESFFAIAGALTVTCRYWWSSNSKEFLTGITQGATDLSGWWTLRVDGAGKLSYACDASSLVSAMTVGQQWQFVCLRRNAAGTVVDLQLDTTTQTSGTLAVPTAGGSFRIGGEITVPTVQGAVADIMIWNKRLTDAQVEAQRVVMMGLP